MKYLFLFCLISWSGTALGQVVNPTIIQQDTDIALHNKIDVYYKPFAPPASTDTRASLSNLGVTFDDPNGVGNGVYLPKTHGVYLSQWCPWPDSTMPHGDTLGQTALWQRLFQARDKPSGAHSDIIAGGNVSDTVTISKNEDVDFRATGTIKMKNGFHVKPGAFFHAYIEPKWDTAVFSDEFNDTAKFRNQWSVRNGEGGSLGGQGATCVTNSNVRLDTDYQAHDGYALDIILREVPDTCSCLQMTQLPLDSCDNVPDPNDTIPIKYAFSSGEIQACPFPYAGFPYAGMTDTPFVPAWAHGPYGKYEFREKIPHTMHHTNNWGGGDYGFEFDLNETDQGGNMDLLAPSFDHKLRRGPYMGHFGRLNDSIIIFSSPAAHWCLSNNPESIIINNIPYKVQFVPGHGMDTVYAPGLMQSEWPAYLANATAANTFSFYYSIVDSCVADNLTWTVKQDGGVWRKFYAAYHDSAGTLLHFSKWNQPKNVTLTTQIIGSTHIHKISTCHWEYDYNNPIDSGILYLDQPLDSTDLHTNTEAYSFKATDLYSDVGYPQPLLPFDGNDTTPGSYKYHTFAMEWLPNEVRFLIDSVVVRRWPDRMVPPGTPYSDWISTLPRTLTFFTPAEEAIDVGTNPDGSLFDPFGLDSTRDTTGGWWGTGYISGTYVERKYFEHAASIPGWPGFEVVGGKTVAHHMIDYIKVWDIPADVKIPNYPQH